MKKLCIAALALGLLLCLCACGDFVSIMPGTEAVPAGTQPSADEDGAPAEDSFPEAPFYTFMGWEELGDNYYSDTPVALSYQHKSGSSEGCVSPVFDRASIIAACDALRGMTVTGRAGEETTQEQMIFTFTMSDGREYAVTFEDGRLSTYTGNYTVSGGEGLWDILFPAYSDGFDLFDLYFDDSIRAFADGFYENTPVSVGRRANSGATLTSDDPAVVEQVFRALAGASVTVVEDRPDQNIDLTQTQDYIFTMEDGSYYTFTFAQQCLAVRANQTYGTVYYWLSGLDGLWDVEIVPAGSGGAFEGGALSGLRPDIQQAAEIANGERDDLTILGVYVDYTIDGESGYLTLDGDTAYSFVRSVASITATGETVESPEGESITVSITLSDWSGPILYFTGNTIQQVVGTSYVCDSDGMSMLRSTILALAEEGHNTVEVDGETTE